MSIYVSFRGACLVDLPGRARLSLLEAPEPKTTRNRFHMDLGEGTPDERWERVYAEVQRHVAAGATVIWRALAALRGHGQPQTATLPKLCPGKRLWGGGFPLCRFEDRGYRSSSKSAPSASALVRGGHLGHPLRRRGSRQSPRRASGCLQVDMAPPPLRSAAQDGSHVAD